MGFIFDVNPLYGYFGIYSCSFSGWQAKSTNQKIPTGFSTTKNFPPNLQAQARSGEGWKVDGTNETINLFQWPRGIDKTSDSWPVPPNRTFGWLPKKVPC